MKYDSRGREVESSEYKHGKLESATHSIYEDNEHGELEDVRGAITNAINDALKDVGAELLESPATPDRIVAAIRAASPHPP